MYPRHDDPDLDKLNDHPAVIQYLKALRDNPGLFSGAMTSFRTVVKAWEDEQERIKQINQALHNRASNPPIPNLRRADHYRFLSKYLYYFVSPILVIVAIALHSFGIYVILSIAALIVAAIWGAVAADNKAKEWTEPFNLDSITLDFHPKIKSKQQAKVIITIQIPQSSDAHTRERLQFKIRVTIDDIFQHCAHIPTADDIRPRFAEAILSEIRELRVPVFRYEVFEPEEESPHDAVYL